MGKPVCKPKRQPRIIRPSMSDTLAPPPKTLRILHLEDADPDHQLARRALAKATLPCVLDRVETLQGFQQALMAGNYDLVLADYHLPGFTALEAWQTMQWSKHKLPFVLLSGAIGESAAVQAIQLGMSDYLAKDDMARLGPVVQRALLTHQTRQAKERTDAELAASERRLAELTAHLHTAIEDERAAIAREIHDDIGGALAAIRFDLAWMARHHADAASQAHVQTAHEMLQQAVSASQNIMMNLRPAVLDQGLGPALEWLVAGFARRTQLDVRLNCQLGANNSGSIRMPKPVELTAYRTAQEALTNAAKHAACTSLRIDCTDAQNLLTLEISDNGTGIAESDRHKPRSFGLQGLGERAKTVGGWLDIGRASSGGTCITLSVPLDVADAHATHTALPPGMQS